MTRVDIKKLIKVMDRTFPRGWRFMGTDTAGKEYALCRLRGKKKKKKESAR